MNWNQTILIALGGCIGAVTRGFINRWLPFVPNQFSWGTFGINLLGCLFIGILWSKLESDTQKLFWITGILGGFTTFSGFGLELLRYLQHKEYSLVFSYGLGSLILGVLMVWVGQKLAA